jgi:XTP/dITP diphosphohydrolase
MEKEEKLLIASCNQGKIREIKKILEDFPFQIIGLEAFPELPEVEEDGKSFEENALKKARTRARETGLLTLADDSGLEVDYLGGQPGIYSARYAGPGADDKSNTRKLLQELAGVPLPERTARFRAVIALVDPESNQEVTVEGKCEGLITEEPRGNNGFGYDPVFFLPEYQKTMAELPAEVKNRISHRAKALDKLREVLKSRYREI